MDFKWYSRIFDEDFGLKNDLQPLQVSRHPLEKSVILVTNRKSSSSNVTGKPLMTTTTSWGGFDPLSDPLADMRIEDDIPELDDEIILKWPSFKAKILSKFKVDKKISIKSSFLSIAKSSNSSGIPSSTSTSSVAEQVRQRLQTIDEVSNPSSSSELISLTSEDFTSKMNQMNQLLLESWNSDQRVKSLKIVIQITKIVAEIPVIPFYPAQLMLIVNILDSFGYLVSSRITNKVNELTMNSNTHDVAIETAKNWFYKVSSIRELVPRFFIEISILKIYKFVFSPNQILENLKRLSLSVNGISHPVVSIYARCFLVKTCADLSASDPTCYPRHSIQKIILNNFKSISSLAPQLEDTSINLKSNYNVLSPAIDWIVNCYKAIKGDENLIFNELDSFGESNCLSCIVLKSILDHCSNSLIETKHEQILNFILNVESGSDFPVSELIVSFGNRVTSIKSLSNSEPAVKRKVINEIWKKMSTFTLIDYLSCASAWIEFVVANLSREESGIVLNDLIRRTTSSSSHQSDRSDSKQIDIAILNIVKSVSKLTSSIQFITRSIVPLLNVISKSEYKIEACKLLIENVVGNENDKQIENGLSSDEEQVSDQETLNSLYSLCKLLANSIDYMTNEDERRNISSLIILCLRVIIFGSWTDEQDLSERELESQLNLLMESRSDFVDLDQVTAYLVNACNLLTVQCLNQGKKGLNRSLIQSCLAYCYITIPSLNDHHVQLQLYLNSAEVSLLTASLSQTDSFLKSAITLLNTLPPGYETNDGRTVSFDNFFIDYSSNLLSLLILVPDHPDHETIYLAKALHTVVTSRQMNDPSHKITVLLRFLAYTSWTRQSKFPYHILGVDSNDKLYRGDEMFATELETFSSKILNEILTHLATIQNEQKKRQSVKQVLDCIKIYGDNDKMLKLCQKLSKLCK